MPSPGSRNACYIALASGLAYAVGLVLTIPYEGGYMNPAITLALWVYKRLDGMKTTMLIAVQFLGGWLQAGFCSSFFKVIRRFCASPNWVSRTVLLPMRRD